MLLCLKLNSEHLFVNKIFKCRIVVFSVKSSSDIWMRIVRLECKVRHENIQIEFNFNDSFSTYAANPGWFSHCWIRLFNVLLLLRIIKYYLLRRTQKLHFHVKWGCSIQKTRQCKLESKVGRFILNLLLDYGLGQTFKWQDWLVYSYLRLD